MVSKEQLEQLKFLADEINNLKEKKFLFIYGNKYADDYVPTILNKVYYLVKYIDKLIKEQGVN